MNLTNRARKIIAVLFLLTAGIYLPAIVEGLRGHPKSEFFFIGDVLFGAASLGLALFFWIGPKDKSSGDDGTHDRPAPTTGT